MHICLNLYEAARSYVNRTTLCIPHILLWGFINSPPFVMAPFAKHWNGTDTHFLLNKAFIFIRLEFMELIVSAHFNNVDSLKHNLGFARLCTCVLVLELTALPQCTFNYCTHYVWKRCKLLCVRLICWIQKCIGFLLKVHNGVLVIAAGFMGCGNPLSLIYI